MGTPGRNFACNLRVRSAALWILSYGSIERRAPDSHRVIRFCRPIVRRLCLARREIGEINGTHTRTAAFTKPNADTLHHDLHLDPPVGAAPTSSPLQEERITDLCHGGNFAPARTCTSNVRLRAAACSSLTSRERRSLLKCNQQRIWLLLESRQPLLVFSEALIFLS